MRGPSINPDTDIRQISGKEAISRRRRILRRFFYWGLPAVFTAGILFFWNTRNGAEPFRYQTQKAVRGDLSITVGATGNLEPTNQVDVGSELSGIIKAVEVDYNDQVEINQVLARLDTEKLQADVTRYQAALEAAGAQVMQARAALKDAGAGLERFRRAHELSGGKLPSAYDLDSAEASFLKAQADEAAALAQVKQARAVLEYAQTDLSKALIRSPINGIVLSRGVEPGQTVAASLQAPVLFTLAEDLSRMELHVDVDEADVGQVKQGQEASFTVDAYPGRVFPARITQMRYGAKNTEGVVTYETVLQVDNAELLLRPGMTATADITVAGVEDAVLVPNPALRFTPPAAMPDRTEKKNSNGSFTSKLLPRPPRRNRSAGQAPDTGPNNVQQVWTLQNGRPVNIQVTTGVTDGILTEITSGNITPDMEVIVGTLNTKK